MHAASISCTSIATAEKISALVGFSRVPSQHLIAVLLALSTPPQFFSPSTMLSNYQHCQYILYDHFVPVLTASATSHKQHQAPEWIPYWLRKSRALPVAALCIVFAMCLEALNLFVNRKNGLSVGPQNAISVNAARYLPTFGAVCLDFMWKVLVQDIKKITPWSTMSGKWSKTSDSVGLDYITTIEPVVLFKAVSRRHWAVFIGLLLGFVCGALVAVANSLTYVDLFATHSEMTDFLKTTTFSYSGISPKSDETLPIPYSHLGQKQYAAIAAERLPGGQSAPWSKDNYVFESFNSTAQVSKNTTIQATVRAVYPNFTCHSIGFTSNGNEFYPTLRGNVSNRPELNFSNDLLVTPVLSGEQSSVNAWLNMTACTESQTDIRFLSILAWYEGRNTLGTALGVLCRPSFTTRETLVRADWATGDILEYSFTSSPPTEQDIQTSMDAIHIYLNNPLDSRTQFVYRLYSASDQILSNYSHEAMSGCLMAYGTDPFNDIITNHLSESIVDAFQKDPEQYQMAVEQLSNSIMSQVLNAFARGYSSQTINGSFQRAGSRMFLRQQSLRVFQALLLSLALACIFQMTLLRPRTCLTEDPGSIASMAVLLATCEDSVSDALSLETPSTGNHAEISLKSFVWQLKQLHVGLLVLWRSRDTHPSHKSLKQDITTDFNRFHCASGLKLQSQERFLQS